MEQESKGQSGTCGGNLDHPSAPKAAGHPLPPSAFTAGRILAASELFPGAVRTGTLPSRAGSQRIPVESRPTPLAVIAHCVVQAAQAPAGHGVAVAHGIEIHVPMALAGFTGVHGTSLPQGIPEKAVITELTAFSWGKWKGEEVPAVPTLPTAPVPIHHRADLSVPGAVGADHLPTAGHLGAGRAAGAGAGLAVIRAPCEGVAVKSGAAALAGRTLGVVQALAVPCGEKMQLRVGENPASNNSGEGQRALSMAGGMCSSKRGVAHLQPELGTFFLIALSRFWRGHGGRSRDAGRRQRWHRQHHQCVRRLPAPAVIHNTFISQRPGASFPACLGKHKQPARHPPGSISSRASRAGESAFRNGL